MVDGTEEGNKVTFNSVSFNINKKPEANMTITSHLIILGSKYIKLCYSWCICILTVKRKSTEELQTKCT